MTMMLNNKEVQTKVVDFTELWQGDVFESCGSWYTVVTEDFDSTGWLGCVELNTGMMYDLHRITVNLLVDKEHTIRFF